MFEPIISRVKPTLPRLEYGSVSPYMVLVLVLPTAFWLTNQSLSTGERERDSGTLFSLSSLSIYLKGNLIPLLSSPSDVSLSLFSQALLLLWLSFILCWAFLYQRNVVETPKFTFVKSPKNEEIFRNFVKGLRAFEPTPWGSSGHLQSAMFCYWPLHIFLGLGKYKMNYRRQLLHLEDGGINALDWYDAGLPKDAPVVILLPGVIGESRNTYIKRFVVEVAEKHGWRSVVKSWRGIHAPMERPKPETWSYRAILDLRAAVLEVKRQFPDAPLLSYGFSFGGQLLQGYLGAYSEDSQILCGVSVSGLFDAATIYSALSSWRFPPYDFSLTMAIRGRMEPVLSLLEEVVPAGLRAQLRSTRTLAEFHHLVTRHFCEPPFASTEEFFRGTGATYNSLFRHIRTPLLCLNATDDPLIPDSVMKTALESMLESDRVFLLQTQRGGHCGWFEGFTGASWLDAVAQEFLSTCLEREGKKEKPMKKTAESEK